MAQAVQVVARTWARDTHDLFDFEAKEPNVQTNVFAVTDSTKCMRGNGDVQMIGEHLPSPPGADPLLILRREMGKFVIDKAASTGNSKKLWLVVRDLASGGHSLAEGDLIKLGRFKFKVRQLAAPDAGAQPELRLGGSVSECKDPGDCADKVCRICLMEGATEEDPFIAPCNCKGSIECVHLNCLQHWTKGRLNHSSGGSYLYKPQTCELCKAPLPDYVRVQGERRPLVEVPTTAPPFIVLEPISRDAQGLHVISLADGKPAKIGRGHDSEVRIADVSISRCHATIRFHEGRFFLEDKGSKFGTLVAMKRRQTLDACSTVSVQAGRTVLSLSMQPEARQED